MANPCHQKGRFSTPCAMGVFFPSLHKQRGTNERVRANICTHYSNVVLKHTFDVTYDLGICILSQNLGIVMETTIRFRL